MTQGEKDRQTPVFLPVGRCGSMRWGLFTCPYQRLPLERAFADARAFGYDYIELWGGRPHAYPPDLLRGDLEKIRRLAGRYEVPVEIYTPEHNAYPFNYMLGNKAQWRDSMDYLAGALRCGKALGADYVLISVGHGEDCLPKERKDRLLTSLRRLTSEAETLEQKIILETLTPFESNTCTRLEELLEVLDAVASPMLLGMCDVVVPFVQGRTRRTFPAGWAAGWPTSIWWTAMESARPICSQARGAWTCGASWEISERPAMTAGLPWSW